eukprot:6455656-Amphidinium_carterae.1
MSCKIRWKFNACCLTTTFLIICSQRQESFGAHGDACAYDGFAPRSKTNTRSAPHKTQHSEIQTLRDSVS